MIYWISLNLLPLVFVHIAVSYRGNYSSHHWHVKLWPFLKSLSRNDPIFLQPQKYILSHIHTKVSYPWKSQFYAYLGKIALSSWAWRIKASKCIKVSKFQNSREESIWFKWCILSNSEWLVCVLCVCVLAPFFFKFTVFFILLILLWCNFIIVYVPLGGYVCKTDSIGLSVPTQV